jgi:hypothetical protein
MSDEENALVPVQGRQFKMPDFGNRASFLKEMLEKQNDKEPLTIVNYADSSSSKPIHKIADSINDGEMSVDNDQQDVQSNAFLTI